MFVWWFLVSGARVCPESILCCCWNKGKVWESQIQFFNKVLSPGDFVFLIPQPWPAPDGVRKDPGWALRWWKYKSQECCWRRKGRVRIPWQNALKRWKKIIQVPCPDCPEWCRHRPMGTNQRIFRSKRAFLTFTIRCPLKQCPGTWRESDWRLQVRNKF